MRKFYIPPFASFDEWDEWEIKMQEECPIRYFVHWYLPIFLSRWYRILWKDPIYYVKCRLFKKYNVVTCVYLPPTWCDRDWLMVHCCFQLLKDFIEKEKPWEFTASESEIKEAYSEQGIERFEMWNELKCLYVWWIKNKGKFDYDTEVIQINLESLIRIRRIMWT